ncbi:MAG: O-antigen ligase family protein [Calditrichia bacterium]
MSSKDSPYPGRNVLVFVVGLLVIPLLYSSTTIDPVLPIRLLTLAALLALSLVLLLQKPGTGKTQMLTASPLVYLILSFFALQLLSSIWAVNSMEALIEVAKLGLLICVFFLSIVFLQKKNSLLFLCHGLAVLAILLSFMGICQYYQLGFTGIPGHFLIYATLVNKNLFASALVLLLPFLFYSAIVHRGSGSILSMAGILLSSIAVGLAHSRAVWIALAILTAIVATGFILRLPKAEFTEKAQAILRKRMVLVLSLTLLACTLTAMLNLYGRATPTYASDAARTAVTATRSLDERRQLWTKSFDMIAEQPIIGVGAGNWKIMFPRYSGGNMRSAEGSVQFVRPHNDFIWVASETGIIGLLLYLGIFGWASLLAWRQAHNSSDSYEQLLAVCLLGGIATFAVISGFSFPRERIVHSLFFWLSAAILVANSTPERNKLSVSLPRGAIIGMLLFSIATGAVGYSRLGAEKALKKSFSAHKQQNWPLAKRHAMAAGTRFFTIDPSATPPAFYQGQAAIKLGDMAGADTALKRAYQQNPHHILTLGNLAAVQQRLEKLAEAERYFKEALVVSPQLESALINLSAVYYQQKNIAKALETLAKCDPKSTNPRIAQYRKIYEGGEK